MNKKILSLLLAVVMVVSMLPANVMAAQTGFTAAPSESGALTAVNNAAPLPLHSQYRDFADTIEEI